MNQYGLIGLVWVIAIQLTLAQSGITELSPPHLSRHSLAKIMAQHPGIYGIDVSHHQGLIHWQRVKQAGVSFAYIKVSEGTQFRDPRFDYNWSETQKAGVIHGAYHFFRADRDPIEQAKHFIKQVKPLVAQFDLPPALDIEYGEDMDQVDAIYLSTQIKQWLEYVAYELQIIPVIYTSQSFWEDYIGPNPVFAKYPLWLSSALRQPAPPSSWQEWTFWQFSTHGYVPGITTAVDLNFYGGSKQEFLKLISNKNYLQLKNIDALNQQW